MFEGIGSTRVVSQTTIVAPLVQMVAQRSISSLVALRSSITVNLRLVIRLFVSRQLAHQQLAHQLVVLAPVLRLLALRRLVLL